MGKAAHQFDGVLLDKWEWNGSTVTRRQTQPNQDVIKGNSQELRKNPDALGHLSFGGLELVIPDLDYIALVKKNPELASRDALTRTLAWKRFMASSDSDEYRVRDRRKARAINTP